MSPIHLSPLIAIHLSPSLAGGVRLSGLGPYVGANRSIQNLSGMNLGVSLSGRLEV